MLRRFRPTQITCSATIVAGCSVCVCLSVCLSVCLCGVEHEKDHNLPLFVESSLETMFLLHVCTVRILSKPMQNPTQQCGACATTIAYSDEIETGRNVCVPRITFSSEQQENADKSRHDGTRSILPKHRPCKSLS